MLPNVLATLIKIEKEEEERRQKAERLKYNVNEHNIGEETQAQKLCRLYNIKVDATRVDSETLKSDLSAFCQNDKAFFQFKKNSTIDKTLSNFNENL